MDDRIERGTMRIFRCSRLLLVALVLIAVPLAMSADVFISVGFGPPPLPVYAQPLCPGPGYLWVPGYWAYGPYGYYWVPGTWVIAPQPGYYWTPGYWGWGDDAYYWHPGYWGPVVGFYGGINYGYGYPGNGYYGGEWRNGNYYYNRSVNNVNVTNIHNVYNQTVVNNVNVTRVSYNGGQGGIQARPTAEQERIVRERHVGATSVQTQHEQMAKQDRSMQASVNHGRPEIAATPRPAAFHGSGVVAARNAPVNTEATRGPERNGENTARPNNENVPHPNGNADVAHPNNTARPPEREATPHPNGNVAVPHPPEREATPHPNANATTPRGPEQAAPRPNNNAEYSRPPERGSAPHPSYNEARPSNPPNSNYGGRPTVTEPRPPAHENAQPPAREQQAPPRQMQPPPQAQRSAPAPHENAARPPEHVAQPPQHNEPRTQSQARAPHPGEQQR
jgi:hypothetical protein